MYLLFSHSFFMLSVGLQDMLHEVKSENYVMSYMEMVCRILNCLTSIFFSAYWRPFDA